MLLNGVNLVADNLGQYIQEALDGAHDSLEDEAMAVMEYLATALDQMGVHSVDDLIAEVYRDADDHETFMTALHLREYGPEWSAG